MPDAPPPRNALAGETSPYLLQHAGNPVAWYPWGEEALERARREGRPLLVSIGYSACHWCHVMAHESFEDPRIAALMNALFVNVKVDREERPDLDRIFQDAHLLLSGRPGGWPLTVFLDPRDRVPFFAGTYFPPEPRHGMPAFAEVLRQVAAFHREHAGEVARQGQALLAALRRGERRAGAAAALDEGPLRAAGAELERAFDRRHGGFGTAPKFPHPGHLELLLRLHARGHPGALALARDSLAAMIEGGLFDQLGGGFYRYSVDAAWRIPHFEKMLYDNGPLLGLCARLAELTGEERFARAALRTAEWVIGEMQAPEGGYYATLDADSEGEEGRYYLWQREEAAALLEPAERDCALPYYGLDGPPGFEGRSWHLRVARSAERIAEALGSEPAAVERHLAAARARLLAARRRRVRPGRDEKVIAAWNGLMIEGMASAGRILGRPELIASAERALEFARTRLWDGRRLMSVYKDGRARFPAYLDDHVLLARGALALLEARWRRADLDLALALAERLCAGFEDREGGGFYFTAEDHEALIHRPKPLIDDALPAGNGRAAWLLGRLGHLLGEPRFLAAAERAVRAAWPSIERAPSAHAALLEALDEQLDPPRIVVLRGSGAELERWRARALAGDDPRRLVLAIDGDEPDLAGLLAERAPRPGGVIAYVCAGTRCLAPVSALEELGEALAGMGSGMGSGGWGQV